MYIHEHKLRVRYSETDQMGFAYHGHFIAYHEVGRVEAMRALGCNYAELEKKGVLMPVISLEAKFIKPTFYDELLTLKTVIAEMPTVRMKFSYEIYGEDGSKKHEGSTMLAFLNKDTLRPSRAPQELIEALKPFFEDIPK